MPTTLQQAWPKNTSSSVTSDNAWPKKYVILWESSEKLQSSGPH